MESLVALNEISHPNLIKLINWAEDRDDNFFYIITEYIDGKNLQDVFKEKNSLNLPQKINITKQIASVMLYLHSFKPPILHRDIKSPNILISNSKEKAFVAYHELSITTTYNDKQSKFGFTPLWADPAYFESNEHNIYYDVYSFGILLYEIFSEKLPYCNHKDLTLLDKIIKGSRPDTSLILKNTPKLLIELMISCWDGDQKKRPDFKAICKALDSCN